jgi:hypothetical protein
MRRVNDFYPTPEWATRELLKHVEINGSVLECCAGDGAIAIVLERKLGKTKVDRNDIDQGRFGLSSTFDAADRSAWVGFPDWVVTNPPFSCAPEIVPIAHDRSRLGCAMLLRLSYLEPTGNRGAWLNQHPPTTLIVLPRISFTGNGKTDNVTCAWMVWDKRATEQQIIIAENPKFTSLLTPEESNLVIGAIPLRALPEGR